MCTHAHSGTRKHVWRSEVNIQCPPLWTSTFIFGDKVSHWTWSSSVCLSWLATSFGVYLSPLHTPEGWHYRHTPPCSSVFNQLPFPAVICSGLTIGWRLCWIHALYVNSGNPNTGPAACVGSCMCGMHSIYGAISTSPPLHSLRLATLIFKGPM